MAITRLALTDFRNHASALIRPRHRFVLLTGTNGAGKTNIVEAVSLLTPGRGLRRAALSEMARAEGPGGFAIAAELDLPGGAIEIGTGASVASPDRRIVRINGATASQQALAEWTACLWLTPAMDRLFVEGAGGRRRFLDRLALALVPGHAPASARYEQGLRERNRLLSADRAPDPAWLDAVEEVMAPAAAAIVQARADLVAALSARLAAEPDGPFARPELMLSDRADGIVPDTAEGWAALWRAARSRDRAATRTLAGPHRAELDVVHATKRQPAARCSTGEQKAMLIAILLAHAALVAERRGSPPLMLLDEVAAHLDPTRRSALFARLEDSGSQVWMTGTEAAPFAEILGSASHYVLDAGRVESAE